MKYILPIVIVLVGIALWVWAKRAPEAPQPIQEARQTNSQTTEQSIAQEQSKKQPSTITTKTGMKIEITQQGTGEAITNGQTATVDYVGKLTDGTVFDASKKHTTTGFSFTLGAGQVIKGWDEGVLGMKIGETRILTIPSDLAYGARGIPGAIPPNATLIFEVTLLGVK